MNGWIRMTLAPCTTPGLSARVCGRIGVVQIAGLGARGSSGRCGVAKAAVAHRTHWRAMGVGPEVRVNAVNPGLVATRWFRQPFGEEAAEAQEVAFAKRTPLAFVATPEHVSQAIMGLIRSDAVTGQHLVVDGGVSAGY